MFLFWGLLAPKPLGVFRYRLLGYACTKNCDSMLNLSRLMQTLFSSSVSLLF